MSFTPQGFDAGCALVAEAFRRHRAEARARSRLRSAPPSVAPGPPPPEDSCGSGSDGGNDSINKCYPLTDWFFQRNSGDGAASLDHPPIFTSFESKDGNAVLPSFASSEYVHGEEADDPDIYVDETLLADPSSVLLPEDNVASSGSTSRLHALEWAFSVAYNHTFQTPVLYFTVSWRAEGGSATAISLSQGDALRLLEQRHRDNRQHGAVASDGWDLVSYDEHPLRGTPCLFLHPCRTAERLAALWDVDDGKAITNHEGAKLLSWLSLVLPAVGIGLPVRLYLRLRKILLEELDEPETLEKRWTTPKPNSVLSS